MTEEARAVDVVFEGELTLELTPPFDSEGVKEALQNDLGHTGVVVTEIFVAEGATDL
jgi:hypothetical protein